MSHNRTRLTITLRKDLLPRIDATIDGKQVRNRSHAIEVLVSNALRPTSRRAVILAGGSGANLRPFTYEMPKAMIPVKGRPILEYTIDRLRDAGITDVMIVIGHLGEKIRDHFGDGTRFGMHIRYAEEHGANGTASPLRFINSFIGNQPFVLVYADVLIDMNIADLVTFHAQHEASATIALTSVKNPEVYGVVKMHGNRVVEFLEKPTGRHALSHLVFTGVAVIDPKVLELIPKRGRAMIETDVFPKLASQDALVGYLFEGQWFDVGTPEIYERALAEWKP